MSLQRGRAVLVSLGHVFESNHGFTASGFSDNGATFGHSGTTILLRRPMALWDITIRHLNFQDEL